MPNTKHVKLFEQLDQEGALNLDEKELRSGQKAAISRGDDILTDEQYAACYLNAIKSLGRAEDTRGRGDTALTRKVLRMGQETTEDWQNVSSAKLSAYLNLKPQTVERTVSKFKLLMQGQREETESNVIWPELANLYDRFESMQKSEVLAMAEEAITSEPDMTAYQEYLDKAKAQSKKSRDKQKDTDASVRREIRSVFLSLVKKFDGDTEKAARITKSALAKAFNADPSDIVNLARMEFKNEESLRKAWIPKRFVHNEPLTVGKGQEQETD
jgi:hypothetical protein